MRWDGVGLHVLTPLVGTTAQTPSTACAGHQWMGHYQKSPLLLARRPPQWSRALRRLTKQSSPTPRQTGARVVHPLKSNQLPEVRLGVTEQRAQQGPPIQGLTCSHFPNLWPQWVGPRRPAQQDRGLLLKPLEGRGASEIKQP
jgi:hypothetical protein